VSGVKGVVVASEAAAATTGMLASGLVAVAGLMLLSAGAVMILYGNKKKQQERAQKAGDAPAEPIAKDPISRIFHDVAKMAMPSKYPIEAASGYGLIASMLMGISGVLTGNMYFVGIGVLASVATAIALFGHEQIKTAKATAEKEGLQFEQSKSAAVGAEAGHKSRSLLKNPIRLSSVLLTINGAVALAAGFAKPEVDPFMVATGICAMIGNAIMAVFVHKNDFNVNAARQAEATPSPRISQARAEKLQPDMPLGYSPA